jgi:hypothetical protein
LIPLPFPFIDRLWAVRVAGVARPESLAAGQLNFQLSHRSGNCGRIPI